MGESAVSPPDNSEAKNLRSNSFEQRTVFWGAYLREDSLKYDRESRSFGADDFEAFF
jgi:hypothetical protein